MLVTIPSPRLRHSFTGRIRAPRLSTILTVVAVFAFYALPAIAFGGSCSTGYTETSGALPQFVNTCINNLPYILGGLALALIAFAAIDNGQLPMLVKNGLYVAAVVFMIGAFITFLTKWTPGCFS